MLDSQEMLCSTTTAAATSSASASNWLDRLRSSKGFPTADNFHLDHFLTNTIAAPSPTPNSSDSLINSNSDSRHAASTAANTQASSTSQNELVGIITNVLSDLFNMGTSVGKSNELRVKSARKQTNPKFCAILKPANVISLTSAPPLSAAPETASSSLNCCGKNLNNANDGDDHDGVEEAGEREMLKGYSRSEVTVIDTSCQGWKFDKLVFRRKNVWKVRDKKGKSLAPGSKKRKPVQLDSANANLTAKKKATTPNLEDATLEWLIGSLSAVKASYQLQNAKELPAVGRGDKALVEKREELYKETPDDIGEVPEKRLHPTRSPGKSKSSGSLVILTEAISTGKKTGGLPVNSMKDSQRQREAKQVSLLKVQKNLN